jgi:hypothetical protein
MTFKLIMGALSVVIMVVAFATYLWQTFRDEGVQPHPFSWFLWGIVTGVVFLVQISQHGGAGSWVVGFTAVICLLIGSVSLLRNSWRFTLFDWLSLVAGFAVFGYYLVSKNPTLSAILATATDLIGYAPTISKGWSHPEKDSVSSFTLNSAKFIPSLFALESYSLATWLYPATLVILNGGVAVLLLLRRRHFGKRTF